MVSRILSTELLEVQSNSMVPNKDRNTDNNRNPTVPNSQATEVKLLNFHLHHNSHMAMDLSRFLSRLTSTNKRLKLHLNTKLMIGIQLQVATCLVDKTLETCLGLVRLKQK